MRFEDVLDTLRKNEILQAVSYCQIWIIYAQVGNFSKPVIINYF